MSLAVATALSEHLSVLTPWLNQPTVRDICYNPNGQLWIDHDGQWQHAQMNALTPTWCALFLQLAARYNGALLNVQTPMLQGVLPSGARLQAMLPPLTLNPAFVIRVHAPVVRTLDSLQQAGLFHQSPIPEKPDTLTHISVFDVPPDDLSTRLQTAILQEKTIIVAGETGCGKTTLLNALIDAIPAQERLIFLEDTKELQSTHNNVVHLLARGHANLSMQQLLSVSLRCRPDRLLMGEIRGSECVEFIESQMTGHRGGMATLHAGSIDDAWSRLLHCYQQHPGCRETPDAILTRLKSVIDIIVVLERYGTQRRCVGYYEKAA